MFALHRVGKAIVDHRINKVQRYRKRNMLREKRAVSPLVSTIILVAIVITIGGAAWAYANTSIGSTLQAQGSEVAKDINTIQERYSIVNVQVKRGVFPSPPHDNVTIWIYNNGEVVSTVWDIFISGTDSFGDAVNSGSYDTSTQWRAVKISVGEMKSVSFKAETTGWTEIHVKVLGEHGNLYTYTQGCVVGASVC